MATELKLQLRELKQGDHVCLIYENIAEQLAIAVQFIKEGLARRERCLYIVDDLAEEEIIQALSAAGVDVEKERERGDLRLLTKRDSYLSSEKFLPEAMIEFVRQAEADALAEGFSGLRLIGEMTWPLGPEPGSDRLIEFEALLNNLIKNSKSVILCQYNRRRLDSSCIHDVIRTHPVAILGDQVCGNPFYEPPEMIFEHGKILNSALARNRLDWWLKVIVERKRADEVIQQLAAIVQSSEDAIIGKTLDGVIVTWNPGAEKLYGYTAEEVKGRSISLLVPPNRTHEVRNILEVLQQGKGVENFETVRKAKDGRLIDVSLSISLIRDRDRRVTGASTIARNITKRKQAEQALQVSENRLNLAVHAADLGLFEHDHQTDAVYWSPMMREIIGWGAEEAAALQAYFGLIHAEDRERIVAAVHQAHGSRGDGLYRVEHRLVRPDGDIRWISVSSRTLFEGEGEARRPLRTVGIVADITERKRVEEELREYAESVQALSRRLLKVQEDERRHLARELHDEIGQLLTGLRLLLKPNDGQTADAVKTRFEHARSIVDQLLKKVRGLSFDLRPAVLDQLGLLPALLALFERYIEQTDVQVNFKHKGVEGPFAPDIETTSYRIVQEALTNVARHAGVGSVSVRVWASADVLGVQIEDRGRGFEPEVVLAEPRSSGFTGMQERVRLLDGDLTIESKPGAGTEITAELPLGSQILREDE